VRVCVCECVCVCESEKAENLEVRVTAINDVEVKKTVAMDED